MWCCCLVTKPCLTLCDPITAARQALSPGIFSNSCPLNQWCHPTISSSVSSFSSCPQSFPASGEIFQFLIFPMRKGLWLLLSDGQSIGASDSASVLPLNIQDWFPSGLTGLIPLLSRGLSGVFSRTTIQKHQIFGTPSSLWPNSNIHAAAAAKSLQSCPTLCDPIDGSPPGSSVHKIL